MEKMRNRELVKWTVSSVIVIIGVFILIRLGFWQLDRLESRRIFNDHYLTQISSQSVNINELSLYQNLENMEYREVIVVGKYDFKNEIYLQNHAWKNMPGYRVVTPLILENKSNAVYIDRGWISIEDLKSIDEINRYYEQPKTINGIIRKSQSIEGREKLSTQEEIDSKLFLYVDIDYLQTEIDLELIPIYIQSGDDNNGQKPYPQLSEIEITEGPHMGYAIQWFFFASLLGFGYPFFVWKQINAKDQE
jgi:surfeit locus 1 family protein